MSRPIVPAPGFNTRPLADRCPNHAPGVNVPATKVFSYRRYCPSCAAELAAFSRAETVSVEGEGVEVVRGWVP